MTWITLYPYLGLEFARLWTPYAEAFGLMRVGLTAYTEEAAPGAILFPKPGPLVQIELGTRSGNFSFSGFFETMNWFPSDVVLRPSPYNDAVLQPDSRMFTLGLKLGLQF